jgi:hypothetical protein
VEIAPIQGIAIVLLHHPKWFFSHEFLLDEEPHYPYKLIVEPKDKMLLVEKY